MLNNSILNNLIDDNCNLTKVESIHPRTYLTRNQILVFDNIDLNQYLDYRSVVVFGKLIRHDWMFTVPSCMPALDGLEPRFVRLFRYNLGKTLRPFFLRIQDIDDFISHHDCFLSGSIVLKALMGTNCDSTDWQPNDIDIYCQGRDGSNLVDRIVNLYSNKPIIDSVIVQTSNDIRGYHLYNIIVGYDVTFRSETIEKSFKVQVISCEGRYGMYRYDFMMLQNSFGVKRHIKKSVQHGIVIQLTGDIPYQQYEFVSGTPLLADEVIVENEITQWVLSIGCVDSLRFKRIKVNRVLLSWLGDTSNMRTVCANIKSLKQSLNVRLAKYLERSYFDRNEIARNTLRCLLYKLYARVRQHMDLVDVSLVNHISLVEILDFVHAFEEDLPLFDQYFDNVINVEIPFHSAEWQMIV